MTEVVGVVGDVRTNFVGTAPPLTIYCPFHQAPLRVLSLAIRTTMNPDSTTQALRQAVARHDPTIPVEQVVSMHEIVGRSLAPQRVIALTLATLAAIAMVMAAPGLYGVLAFSVATRRREIGVRIALGAARGPSSGS